MAAAGPYIEVNGIRIYYGPTARVSRTALRDPTGTRRTHDSLAPFPWPTVLGADHAEDGSPQRG
jgi:hypothetical protein